MITRQDAIVRVIEAYGDCGSCSEVEEVLSALGVTPEELNQVVKFQRNLNGPEWGGEL
jgi:hypothetical protein